MDSLVAHFATGNRALCMRMLSAMAVGALYSEKLNFTSSLSITMSFLTIFIITIGSSDMRSWLRSMDSKISMLDLASVLHASAKPKLNLSKTLHHNDAIDIMLNLLLTTAPCILIRKYVPTGRREICTLASRPLTWYVPTGGNIN